VPKELTYRIGISLIKGIGPVLARNIIAYTGSVEAVFSESKKALSAIPGIGPATASAIIENRNVIELAEKEVDFVEKNKIKAIFFTDENYPKKLGYCDDAPLMLYVKGDAELDLRPVLSIVGTRRATDRGIINCENLIEGLAQRYPELLIVSGLAYGIDICAHKAAMKNGISTVSVVAHGLDRIYPYVHRETAKKMVESGGAVITEFISGTVPDRHNFVQRNRIVAGLAEAVVVVESGLKGGALITAGLAHSYNRDVLAIPGNPQDEFSKGCNFLIKRNIAALIENAEDVEYALGWESRKRTDSQLTQRKLFPEFGSEEERLIYAVLSEEKELTSGELSVKCDMPVSRINSLLLNLEFQGLVKALPGNAFRVLM